MTTYNPFPVTFEKGDGAWLYDTEGRDYLDALGGVAVCALGHHHPVITDAILDQAQRLLHTSNAYHIQHAEKLAKKLCEITGMEEVFFANSGAEANEAALKLSRLYGHQKNIEFPHLIVMEKSFHGRTLAMLSASGNRKIQAGYEPFVQGFIRCPFNNIEAAEQILQSRHDIAGIMVEPIQGEGGIFVPDPGYLKALRELCDKYDCLLILDEVQTGIGRTGKFFAYQHENILPDVVTCAKALGNGIPIGACLARGKAAHLFKPGMHGSTFGGNPFATRVGLAVLEALEQDKLIARASELGHRIKTALTEALANHPHVKAVRGKGLMIGIELDKPCREIMQIGLNNRILFNVTSESVIRLLPPYILTDEEADLIVTRIVKTIEDYYAHE
jgi:acetylornithine aminotransferase